MSHEVDKKTRHGLFCKFSPDSDFFLHNKILESLRNEGHFLERLRTNGTWRGAQGVQTVYTGFTPCSHGGWVSERKDGTMDHATHFVIARAHEQAEFGVQVSVRFANWTLIVHGLYDMSIGGGIDGCERDRETDEILGCPSRGIFNPAAEYYRRGSLCLRSMRTCGWRCGSLADSRSSEPACRVVGSPA